MSEITFKQLETEVRRLAEENPEFIYDSYYGSCFYNPTEREGEEYGACIFGQAFSNLGEPVNGEGKNIGTILSLRGIGSVWDRSWAARVQKEQDARVPWGNAVEIADQMVKIG